TWVEAPALNIEGGVAAAQRILGMPADDRPDAVFAPNDMVALGMMETLSIAGLRIPEDIAIVGYDDVAFAASARIPICSVRQPAEQLGAAAVDHIMEMLSDGPAARRRVAFVPELIARQSTLGT